MLRPKALILAPLLAAASTSALASASENLTERRGVPVTPPSSESILNPKNLSNEIPKHGPMKIVKVHSIERPAVAFDAKNFKADTRGLAEVCFTSIGPKVPYRSLSESEDQFAPNFDVRAMTCEKRDSIVKALGLASVFMKGTSYACSFIPLPQVQLTAKIIDISSYATSSVAIVISTTKCENTLEAKFNAVLKVCDELNAMGLDCQGVDNEPF
jgi:hypothetical protein